MKKLHKILLTCVLAMVAVAVCLLLRPMEVQAASVSDLRFELNSDRMGYSVERCNTSASGELVIPDTYYGKPVTRIGSSAFAYRTGLTSITIPGSVTSIGYDAFEGCTSLTSITIPDSVTSIGYAVFCGCTSLTSATIGNGVASIVDRMFHDCTSLTSITIPDSVTRIGGQAFDGCRRLTDVYYAGTQDQWFGMQRGFNNSSLTSAKIHYTAVFAEPYLPGDIDGDEAVTQDDAVYLLLHTMFGEAFYPLNNAPADINGNGTVDQDDAIYLLLHTMFGETFYPLNIPALPAKTKE